MKLRKVLSLFVALVMTLEVLPLSSLATEIADATENVEATAETVAEEVEEEAETEETVEETDVSAESDVVLGNTAEGVLMISSSVTRTASLAVASVSAVSSSEESEPASDEENAEDISEENDDSTADEAEADSEDATVEDETISDEETVDEPSDESGISLTSMDSSTGTSGTCGVDGDNLTWELTSDGVLTISGTGEMADFSSVSDQPWYYYDQITVTTVIVEDGVTRIGDYAFYAFRSLTQISLPDTLTSIGRYAFWECESLESIILPDSVETIESYAFAGCDLLSYIKLPDGLATLGAAIFSGCDSLKEISIPANITTCSSDGPFYRSSVEKVVFEGNVPDYVMRHCTTLTEVVFAGETTEVGEYSFYYCTSLQEIVLPDGLVTIEKGAFWNCTSLMNVVLPEGLLSIGSAAFENCASMSSITLPNSLTTLGWVVFSGCTELTEITIPSNFALCSGNGPFQSSSIETVYYESTVVPDMTFEFCTTLKKIVFVNGLFEIGEMAFYGCTSLGEIDLPDGLTSIGSQAFQQCTALSNIVIPDTVLTIDTSAFAECTSLTNVTLSTNLSTLSSNTFKDCTALCIVELPDSLEVIDDSAFYGCTSLEEIDLPESLITIGSYVFCDCGVLSSIVLPDSVTSIGSWVFKNCISLTAINLPANAAKSGYYGSFSDSSIITVYCKATIIPDYTFKDCTTLTTVIFTGETEEIGYGAFYDCTSLSDITLPDSLTTIYESAFYGCTSLTKINLPLNLSKNGDDSSSSPFQGSALETVICESIVVPASILRSCTSLKTVIFTGNTTCIEDNAFRGCTSLTDISLPEGLLSIGSSAFNGCTSLSTLVLPDSLTTLGYAVFYGCTSLTEINIPAGFSECIGKQITTTSISYGPFSESSIEKVTYEASVIPDYMFKGCTTLNEVIFTNAVVEIGNYAFSGCTALSGLDLPEGVISVGDYAFASCTSLSELTLPDSITTLGSYIFNGCTVLTSINLPRDLTTVTHLSSSATKYYGSFTGSSIKTVVCEATVIPAYTFYNITTIEGVTFTGNTTEIGNYAFYGCTSLSEITLPDSLTTIGARAFNGCDSLTEINLPVNLTTVSYDVNGGLFTNSGLKSVICEANIVPDYTLYKCTSLTTVTFTGNTTEIGDYAFSGCTALSEIELPSSLTTLGNYVFNGCTGITEVTIPSGLTASGENGAFSGSSITVATISDGMTIVPEYLFRGRSITELIIPASVTEVGKYATFSGSALTDVYYAGTESQWNEITINICNNLTATSTRTIHYESTGAGSTETFGGVISTTSTDVVIYYGEEDAFIKSFSLNWDEDDVGKTFTVTSSDSSVVELTSDTSYTYDGSSTILFFAIYGNALSTGTSVITISTSDGAKASFNVNVEEKENEISLAIDECLMIDETAELTATITFNTIYSTDSIVWTSSDSSIVAFDQDGTASVTHSLDGATLTLDDSAQMDDSVTIYGLSIGSAVITCSLSSGATATYEIVVYDDNTLAIEVLAYDWYTAWQNYITEVLKVLKEMMDGVSETTIEQQAEALMNADESSDSKLVNFEGSPDKETKLAVYQAVAQLIADESENEFDLGSIDVSISDTSSVTIAASIVTAVANSIRSISKSYTVGEHTVVIAGSGYYGAYLATISVDGERVGFMTSTVSQMTEVMTAYIEELLEIEENLVKEAYKQMLKSVIGTSINDLTTTEVTNLLSKYTTAFANTGVGQVTTVVCNCIDYYKYVKKLINYSSDPMTIFTSDITQMKLFSFDDSVVTSKTVKVAVKALETTKNALNEAVEEYLTTGEVDVKESVIEWAKEVWSGVKATIMCPVSVEIYDSTGTQVGYVGDDDLWYDEDVIYIVCYGETKTIYSNGEELSFKITGTDDGTLNCTFEEYSNGQVVSRINYYDISLYDGKQLSAQVADSDITTTNTIVIEEGQLLEASESISSEQYSEATVSITLSKEIDGGLIYGDGDYVRGDAVAVYAIAESGYRFVGWKNSNGAYVSVSSSYEFTAREDIALTAVFVSLSEEEDAKLILETETTLSSTDWTLTQSDVESAIGSTTADKISTLIYTILAGLGIDSNVTVTYTITDITEAIAGDATDTDGTDGSFTINFAISAGNESDTLTETGTITATEYVHTHSLTHVEAVDATCTAEGNTEYWYCSDCDKYYSDENAENEITLADTVTAKIAHDYEAVVTEPTCTEGGYTTYTCSVCKDSYVADETAALGHDYTSEVTKEATCTEAGVMTYTCTRGDDSYTAEIPATGHTEGEAIIENEVAATCTTDGSYDSVVYCSICHEELLREAVVVPAAHTAGTAVRENVVEATRTTEGSYDLVTYCTVCGEEISRETVTVPATGVDMVTVWLRTPVDYSAVNNAIAKANALDSGDYTNFSDVTDAINAVNWTYNALMQSYVNEMAEKIETAIANLIPVGTTTEEVEIQEPIEDTNTDTEDDEESFESSEPETNPTTGIAISLLPMMISALAAVSAKRR
ncbi:MAG: leucine-rich repeat protein [Oscillospiraceae bacterium]|nr:leucine-rich repeat protein [Oscillospiraceae bacterium]